jgi:hypothetical protein
MRTCTYKSLLDGALKMAGESPSAALTEDKLRFSEFLAQGLAEAHEYWRWPELCRLERRHFRPTYAAATTYAAGTEVYDPASQRCYRALRPATGQAPATLAAGTYSTNTAYWWACISTVTAADWTEGTDYLAGDLVRRPSDGLTYACYTTHTASASFDPAKFGAIEPFRPYIAYEQTGETAIEAVLACYSADPRADPAAGYVAYSTEEEGIRFAADAESPVWVEFRRRCAEYHWSEEWAAGAYAAGAVVYYPTTGGVYQAASAATASDIPGTAALWVLQEVPYIFRDAVKWKALARWYEAEGQTDKALAHEGKFAELLEEQVWQYTKLQGQTGRTTILPTPR